MLSWSNFAIAEQDRILPCRLFIPADFDAPADQEIAIRTASGAPEDAFIGYRKGEWGAVVARFESDILPAFHAARERQVHLAGEHYATTPYGPGDQHHQQ